jgi:hypothetical protein
MREALPFRRSELEVLRPRIGLGPTGYHRSVTTGLFISKRSVVRQ